MSRLAGIGLALLLAACASAPTPQAPPVPAAVPAAGGGALRDPALDRLITRGLAANLDLAVAAERIRAQRALRRELAGARYPQLAASARYDRERSADGRDEDYLYGLEVAWELDLFGRLAAQERSAAALTEASAADAAALRISLAAEIATLYLQLRLAQREEAIALGTVEVQDETVRITRVRFEQGAISGYDLDRLEAQAELVRAAVPLARAESARLRHALAYLLDLSPDELTSLLAGPEELPALPAPTALGTLLEAPAAVLDARPDVHAARLRLDAAGADLTAARALRYPQLSLGSVLGFGQGTAAPVWSVGGGLLQPLFDFGRIRAGIEGADARQRQAWLGYRSTQNRAAREVRDALVAYEQSRQRQAILARAVERSASATAVARRQYEVGTLSLIEVLDSQRTLFDARLGEAQAHATTLQRWIDTRRALGGTVLE